MCMCNGALYARARDAYDVVSALSGAKFRSGLMLPAVLNASSMNSTATAFLPFGAAVMPGGASPPLMWGGHVAPSAAHPGHPLWDPVAGEAGAHPRQARRLLDPKTKHWWSVMEGEKLDREILGHEVRVRSVEGRYLSVAPTDAGTVVDTWTDDDASGRQRWIVQAVGKGGKGNEYTLAVAGGRAAKTEFLSVSAAQAVVDVWPVDDASGRQRWKFKRVGSKYMIWVSGGRNDDKLVLTALPGGKVTLCALDNSNKAQRWALRLPKDGSADKPDESDEPKNTPSPVPAATPGPAPATQVPVEAAGQLLKVIGLAAAQVDTTLQLISLPENGHPKWWENYGYAEFLGDGRGYTVTLYGACSGTGDLLMIFDELADISPGHPMLQYHAKLREKRGEDVRGIEPLLKLIPAAASDPAWRKAVWRVYVDLYWQFAADFADKKGACAKRPGPVLALATSRGFMVDTAINHGADMSSFDTILKRMPAGARESKDEIVWMNAFIDTRYDMLKSGFQHLDTSKTGDRCKLWRQMLDEGNYALAKPIMAYKGYWGSKIVA